MQMSLANMSLLRRASGRALGICLVLLFAVVGTVGARADRCPAAADEIATDRPDVTNSSVVVPSGSIQSENGVLSYWWICQPTPHPFEGWEVQGFPTYPQQSSGTSARCQERSTLLWFSAWGSRPAQSIWRVAAHSHICK